MSRQAFGAVLALAVLVGACGAPASGQTVVVATAEASLANARTFRLSETLRVFDTQHPQRVEESGQGTAEYDLRRSASQNTFVTTIAGDAAPTDPGASPGTVERDETITIGADVWTTALSPPGALNRDLTPAKPWTHFRESRPVVSVQEALLGKLAALGVSGRATLAGHETVEGVPTSRYVEQLPAPTTGVSASTYGPSTVEVWIDRLGVLRQLRFTTELKAQNGSDPPTPTETMTETATVTDIGTPVSIAPPPADQAADAGPNPTSFPQPSGQWHTAERGRTDGVNWTVLTTAASRSGECVAVETTPSLPSIDIQLAGNGGETSSPVAAHPYRGHNANCAPGPDGGDLDLLAPLLAGDAAQGTPGAHYIAGLATPGASNVVVHLSDGTTVDAQINGGTYVSWWTGDRTFERLTFDYPGGVGLACDNRGEQAGSLDGISCSGGLSNSTTP